MPSNDTCIYILYLTVFFSYNLFEFISLCIPRIQIMHRVCGCVGRVRVGSKLCKQPSLQPKVFSNEAIWRKFYSTQKENPHSTDSRSVPEVVREELHLDQFQSKTSRHPIWLYNNLIKVIITTLAAMNLYHHLTTIAISEIFHSNMQKCIALLQG